MAATDYQGPFVPLASIGRSIISFRRDQVHAMDAGHKELASFQRQVADLFHDLSAAHGGGGGDELLSIDWIRKLLDSFIICQEEFRMVLFNHRSLLALPPLDRMMADFLDRSVKTLDVLNAVRDGIEQLRQLRSHLGIVLAALDPRQRSLGQGQLRRANKALAELVVKDASGAVLAQRNRSFGRGGRDLTKGLRVRSLSWSVSRSWSAARQLHAMATNLTAPRGQDVAASHGLANLFYTMSTVILFVSWALVAAFPCQDRGLQTQFSIPHGFPWAAPIMSLHDRILEESKKKDRKHSSGLLREIHRIEKCARRLMELINNNQFSLSEEGEMEVKLEVQELSEVCEALKDGLDPLECQVREVFRRMVRSRTEGLNSSSQQC